MKVFQCGNCNHPLYFENNNCENCGHLSGYLDKKRQMLTFDPNGAGLCSDRAKIAYKFCANNTHNVCNWIIPENEPQAYCNACQLNRTIPDLSYPENVENWTYLEIAKHRLIYQLQKIGLKITSKLFTEEGMCFDFITKNNSSNVMTGHANGVITILLKEADSALREQTRKELHEPYRTLIGHLRHEVGHYFWERLILGDPELLKEFRTIFGDENANYAQALKIYYQNGAPANWHDSFISQYATSHPWEDWAETWAHYLHIMDMVETAHFFRLKVNAKEISKDMKIASTFDPYTVHDFNKIVRTSIPLSFAVNSINRAMGIADVYPFKISDKVIQKMNFIHHLVLPYRKLKNNK